MVNLEALIAFWKRKDSQSAPEPERIIPLPAISALVPEAPRTTSKEAVDQAREALKVLKLERQILGSAVATIYESQTKGLISTIERDRLLEKYKADLKRLERSIEENQRVVDLFDLESAREELVRNFKTKLGEIDARIKNLKSAGPPSQASAAQRSPDSSGEKKTKTSEDEAGRSGEKQPAKEKKPKNEEDQQISDAEKRVEQIREEILKAMDRLEQIEAEG